MLYRDTGKHPPLVAVVVPLVLLQLVAKDLLLSTQDPYPYAGIALNVAALGAGWRLVFGNDRRIFLALLLSLPLCTVAGRWLGPGGALLGPIALSLAGSGYVKKSAVETAVGVVCLCLTARMASVGVVEIFAYSSGVVFTGVLLCSLWMLKHARRQIVWSAGIMCAIAWTAAVLRPDLLSLDADALVGYGMGSSQLSLGFVARMAHEFGTVLYVIVACGVPLLTLAATRITASTRHSRLPFICGCGVQIGLAVWMWLGRSPFLLPGCAAGTFAFGVSLALLAGAGVEFQQRRRLYGRAAFRWCVGALFLVSVGTLAGSSYAYVRVDDWLGKSCNSRLLQPSGVSPAFLSATVAMEDGYFFEHGALDFVGIHRALRRDLRKGQILEGGSTLSQQLAKNLFLGSERTLWRKLCEAFIAFELERRLSKEQILSAYVHTIDYGMGYRGVDQAAEGYFHRTPAQLTLPMSATLVGIVPKPPRCAEDLADLGRIAEGRQVALDRIRAFFPDKYAKSATLAAGGVELSHLIYPLKDAWDRHVDSSLPADWNGICFYFDLAPGKPAPLNGMHRSLMRRLVKFLSEAHRQFGLVGIDHIGTYNDRLQRGSKRSISAHAFGQAIDISGFRFADGSRFRVADHEALSAQPRLAAMEKLLRRYFDLVIDWKRDPVGHGNHFHAEVFGPRQFSYREP